MGKRGQRRGSAILTARQVLEESVNEILAEAGGSEVGLAQAVAQSKGVAQLGFEIGGAAASGFEPAAACGAIGSKTGQDHVAARPERMPKLTEISAARFRIE